MFRDLGLFMNAVQIIKDSSRSAKPDSGNIYEGEVVREIENTKALPSPDVVE